MIIGIFFRLDQVEMAFFRTFLDKFDVQWKNTLLHIISLVGEDRGVDLDPLSPAGFNQTQTPDPDPAHSHNSLLSIFILISIVSFP